MNEEGNISTFNEAALKMKRIDDSQTIMNRLRHNLLGMDFPPKRNYNIFIAEMLSLLSESKGKMSKKEYKLASDWRETITKIQRIIIFQYEVIDGFGETRKKECINEENWETLRTAIFNMEDFVREQLEKHGYGSPSIESEALWD